MTSTFFDDFIGKLFGILKAVPRQTVTRGISVSRSSSSLSDISKALYDQLEGILTTAQFSCLDSEEFQKNFGEDVQALNGVFEVSLCLRDKRKSDLHILTRLYPLAARTHQTPERRENKESLQKLRAIPPGAPNEPER